MGVQYRARLLYGVCVDLPKIEDRAVTCKHCKSVHTESIGRREQEKVLKFLYNGGLSKYGLSYYQPHNDGTRVYIYSDVFSYIVSDDNGETTIGTVPCDRAVRQLVKEITAALRAMDIKSSVELRYTLILECDV